jgi:hypothetical protein
MIVLTETTDKLEAVLRSAVTTNQLRCMSAWRDITATDYTPGRTLINTNSTTDVTVVGSPGASTQRVVDLINIYNHDTVAATVTIKFDANGTEYVLWNGTLAAGETLTYVEGSGWSRSSGTLGYAINVQALTSSPTDAQTIYFGTLPKAPVTAAGTSKVYIPKAGRITRVEIYCYSGTAGTAESWSLYVRHQNTTDYLIATLTSATNERIFSNSALTIAVAAGDYIEIKGVQPTWATNPATTIYGGYIYIE